MKTMTCPACRGARRSWGPGMIKFEDCSACKGVGHVLRDEEPIKENKAARKKKK